MIKKILLAALVAMLGSGAALSEDAAPEGPRVLFLNKSAGFEHSVVVPDGDKPSLTTIVLTDIVGKMGGTITATKDASTINAENLKNYDLVIFYTTGDLTEAGTDGTTPMGEDGLTELFDWIKAGGGFMGLHSASDTFHSVGDTPSDYISMVGGEFAFHGAQFFGTLRVVDPKHPAIPHFEDGWKIKDEWYFHTNLNKENMHVLVLLDAGKMREKDERYNTPDYPVVWCSSNGDGRVFYNAMGHREDVWENPAFQTVVEDSINWTIGKGEAMTEPNYTEVVPTELPEK